jgi:hypothetical protein
MFSIFFFIIISGVMGHLYIEEVSNSHSDQSDSLRFLSFVRLQSP